MRGRVVMNAAVRGSHHRAGRRVPEAADVGVRRRGAEAVAVQQRHLLVGGVRGVNAEAVGSKRLRHEAGEARRRARRATR